MSEPPSRESTNRSHSRWTGPASGGTRQTRAVSSSMKMPMTAARASVSNGRCVAAAGARRATARAWYTLREVSSRAVCRTAGGMSGAQAAAAAAPRGDAPRAAAGVGLCATAAVSCESGLGLRASSRVSGWLALPGAMRHAEYEPMKTRSNQ
eukprot:scaffold14497_cov116-Isochrysis_galbana.AAC.5